MSYKGYPVMEVIMRPLEIELLPLPGLATPFSRPGIAGRSSSPVNRRRPGAGHCAAGERLREVAVERSLGLLALSHIDRHHIDARGY
jgi:hypothetical protein